MEKNLQQLESQEENVDQQRTLVQQILSKLPTEVIVKLEESKNLDENWTVKLLRESLKRYINIHENVQRHEHNSRGSTYRGQRRGDNYERPPVGTQANQPVEALLVDSAKSTERQRNQTHRREPTLPCIFCRGVHFNDNCDKFTTVTDRKHQLITQGRCFLCLKVGHPLKECPNAHSKLCYHCKKLVITIEAYVRKGLLFHLKHQLQLK